MGYSFPAGRFLAVSPITTVSWHKDGSALHSEGRFLIRAEGERHTLLLREAQTADAGSYTATATNELGQATCAAALAVRPGRDPAGGWGLGIGEEGSNVSCDLPLPPGALRLWAKVPAAAEKACDTPLAAEKGPGSQNPEQADRPVHTVGGICV